MRHRHSIEIRIISFLQNKPEVDHDNSFLILICHTMFENLVFCNRVRVTESYSIHLFGLLFEIYFYSTMKKRIQIQQIGDRTWIVYRRKSQGYGRKRLVFRLFGSDRITAGNDIDMQDTYLTLFQIIHHIFNHVRY